MTPVYQKLSIYFYSFVILSNGKVRLNGLIEAITENGGEIRHSTSVSRIVIEDGAVLGVEVERGQRVVPTQVLDTELIEAPVVVSAVAIWDIFNILSEDELAPWYVERLEYLHRRTLNLLTINFALESDEYWDHSGIRWIDQGPATGKPWCAPVRCDSWTLGALLNQSPVSFVS